MGVWGPTMGQQWTWMCHEHQRGERSAAALVRAIAQRDDRVETHYLEVKSTVTLDKAGFAKIAKYILGSANRMPETAAGAFEGYGVMVIGVAPRQIMGMPKTEVLDLARGIEPFLGPEGPAWDLIHVPVDDSDHTVLVIVVDPPPEGQGPYPCHKEGPDIFNGRIYIREQGATREARATEVEQLVARSQIVTDAVMDCDVDILGTAVAVSIDDELTVNEFLEATAQNLRDAVPKPLPKPDLIDRDPAPLESTATGLERLLAEPFSLQNVVQDYVGAMTLDAAVQRVGRSDLLDSLTPQPIPENRTQEAYELEIQDWIEAVRGAWPKVVDGLAACRIPAVRIRVSNRNQTFLAGLELKLHLEGAVRGLESQASHGRLRRSDLGVPDEPRAWGPREQPDFHGRVFGPSNLLPTSVGSESGRVSLDWKNSGSVDLTIRILELRPRGVELVDPTDLVLIVPIDWQGPVVGTWQLTAQGHHQVLEGALSVAVGDVVDLTQPMREVLGLARS